MNTFVVLLDNLKYYKYYMNYMNYIDGCFRIIIRLIKYKTNYNILNF